MQSSLGVVAVSGEKVSQLEFLEESFSCATALILQIILGCPSSSTNMDNTLIPSKYLSPHPPHHPPIQIIHRCSSSFSLSIVTGVTAATPLSSAAAASTACPVHRGTAAWIAVGSAAELLWRQIGLKLLSGWKGRRRAAAVAAEMAAADDATKASFLIWRLRK